MGYRCPISKYGRKNEIKTELRKRLLQSTSKNEINPEKRKRLWKYTAEVRQ